MAIPIILLAGAALFVLWFLLTGGIDDIGENTTLLIAGIAMGAVGMSVLG